MSQTVRIDRMHILSRVRVSVGLALVLFAKNTKNYREYRVDISLKHLRHGKAPRPDNIHAKLLVHAGDHAKAWLRQFFNKCLLLMYNASKLITTFWMYILYCSLCQPHISHGNDMWGNTYASIVNCLCIIQRKVVRLICNADRLAHTKEFFKKLYIL